MRRPRLHGLIEDPGPFPASLVALLVQAGMQVPGAGKDDQALHELVPAYPRNLLVFQDLLDGPWAVAERFDDRPIDPFSGPGACLRPWRRLPLAQSTPWQIRNAGAFGRLATSGSLIAVLVERIQPEPRPLADAQVQRPAELVARRRITGEQTRGGIVASRVTERAGMFSAAAGDHRG